MQGLRAFYSTPSLARKTLLSSLPSFAPNMSRYFRFPNDAVHALQEFEEHMSLGEEGGSEAGSEDWLLARDTIRVSERGSASNAGSGESVDVYWRQLVSNPEEWWDNRTTRKNPRAPDFKHKITRKALWIDNWQTPDWVRAKFQS